MQSSWNKYVYTNYSPVLLVQFSLYVHKGGLKPDLFHFTNYSQYHFLNFHPIEIELSLSKQNQIKIVLLILLQEMWVCEIYTKVIHYQEGL